MLLLLLLMFLLLELRLMARRAGAGENGHIEGANAIGRQFRWDRLQFFTVNFDGHLFDCFAAVDALVGRDVAEITPDGELHEVIIGAAAIGGVEADPAREGKYNSHQACVWV